MVSEGSRQRRTGGVFLALDGGEIYAEGEGGFPGGAGDLQQSAVLRIELQTPRLGKRAALCERGGGPEGAGLGGNADLHFHKRLLKRARVFHGDAHHAPPVGKRAHAQDQLAAWQGAVHGGGARAFDQLQPLARAHRAAHRAEGDVPGVLRQRGDARRGAGGAAGMPAALAAAGRAVRPIAVGRPFAVPVAEGGHGFHRAQHIAAHRAIHARGISRFGAGGLHGIAPGLDMAHGLHAQLGDQLQRTNRAVAALGQAVLRAGGLHRRVDDGGVSPGCFEDGFAARTGADLICRAGRGRAGVIVCRLRRVDRIAAGGAVQRRRAIAVVSAGACLAHRTAAARTGMRAVVCLPAMSQRLAVLSTASRADRLLRAGCRAAVVLLKCNN